MIVLPHPKPVMPKFMSYVPNRRKPHTMHTHLGHASNSLWMNATTRDWDVEYDPDDPDGNYDRRYKFSQDCMILGWVDELNDWEVLYEVKKGTSWADRPWRDKVGRR